MKDIKQELLKIAEENVNKKLEEERKKNEAKIEKEIKDVNFILELIEKKMLYKVIGDWREDQRFEMITKEMFLKDYTSEPQENWHKRGITIKKWNGWKESYDLEIVINDEIRYKHIGYIIKDFTETLKDKKDRISRITEGLNEIERQFKELAKQETNIMKFIKDYNETQEQLNRED